MATAAATGAAGDNGDEIVLNYGDTEGGDCALVVLSTADWKYGGFRVQRL